ncbi:MAG: hypothetical protein NWE91_02815 [Candidatus Bathyarchaeota archaeon]|nr:hypothetical protein [Candidatus Bathyarchaeota archaeon]
MMGRAQPIQDFALENKHAGVWTMASRSYRLQLKIKRVNYEKLGLKANPFPSVPVCSDSEEDFFSEKYVKREFRVLRKLIVKNCRSRSSRMAIYVFGDCGCGKSTLFQNFVRRFCSEKHFLPIYCRFPFYGGIRSLYQEVVKRVEKSILRELTRLVTSDYPFWAPSYFLRKAKYAGLFRTEWEMIQAFKVSAYYAVKAFQDLVLNLLSASKRDKVVLFLDDLEHAWVRFTGPQRFRWEETLTKMIPNLKRKLILVLPINAKILASDPNSSRPYFGMHNWHGINLDHYIKFKPEVTVTMQKEDDEVLALALELINNKVKNEKGRGFCKDLVNNLPKPIGSVSEVLQRLYFETRRTVQ